MTDPAVLFSQMWAELELTTISGTKYKALGEPDSGHWGTARSLRDQIEAALQPLPPLPFLVLLTWKPPTLSSPITVTIPASGGVINLAAGQDYILKAPHLITAGVTIKGGRNVVWIGGQIQYPAGTLQTASTSGIKFTNNAGANGIIHLEGLFLDGSTTLSDGIVGGQYASMSVPSGTVSTAILQIQNCRVRVKGDSTINHMDCIQHYGGWLELRVDRFTGRSSYQGFELPHEDGAANNQGVLTRFDLRNVNLADDVPVPSGSFQTLLHFGDKNGSFDATTWAEAGNLLNVYLAVSQRSFAQELYPNPGTANGTDGTVVHATVAGDGTISWPSSHVSGFVMPGVPPGGDFVPLGVAGLGYVSPGYLP